MTFARRPNDLVKRERVTLIKPHAKADIFAIGGNWNLDKTAWITLKQRICGQSEIDWGSGFYGLYCDMQYFMCNVGGQTKNDELGVLVRVKEPHSE